MKIEKSLFRLGKHAMIYGGTSVVTAALGFLLILFATRMATPAQYGTIELFRVTNQFLAFVIVVGMDMAQSYFFYKTDEAQARNSKSSLNGALLQFRMAWGLAAVAAAAFIVPWALAKWSGVTAVSHSQLFWTLAWCWAFETSLIPLTHFRLSSQPLHFGFFSILHTLLAGGLAVLGMAFWSDPVTGYLAGFGSASWIVLIAMVLLLRRQFLFWPPQTQWWGRLFRFGFPFLYSAPFLFGLQTADRWFVLKWLGSSELGIYAVGAQFAAMTGGVVTVFITAWSPIAMSKLESEDGPKFFRTVARLYLGGFSALAVGLTLVLPILLRWSTTDVYHGAVPVARILLWAPILYGFFYLAAGGIWKLQKTAWVAALMGAALAVNLAANVWAVPHLGIVGAAFSSVLAFLVMAFAALWISERLWKIHCPFMIFAAQLVLGFTASAVVAYLESRSIGFIWRALAVMPAIGAILYITLRDEMAGVRQ